MARLARTSEYIVGYAALIDAKGQAVKTVEIRGDSPDDSLGAEYEDNGVLYRKTRDRTNDTADYREVVGAAKTPEVSPVKARKARKAKAADTEVKSD